MSTFDEALAKTEALKQSTEDLLAQAKFSNQRIEHLSEALYCTGHIAVIHHTTILRMIRLLRELNKETDWVEKCPKLYERLESIQDVAGRSLKEYNDRLSAIEEAIQ